MFTDIIIMAGGSGTRLWPASNSRVPKQFLSLGDGSTFFGAALERAFAIAAGGGSVVVVAGAAHVPHAVKAASVLAPAERDRVVVIPEPAGRNTAPAVACAAVFLSRRYGAGAGRRALVLTSDHVIGPMDSFRSDAEAADALAADDKLVVFGIPPTRPETGFGYIEAGAPLPSAAAPGRTFAVASFREKPDQATAEGFLATGRFTWNSGMFGFGVDFMLSQFRSLAPETLAPFDPLPTPAEGAYERRDGVAVLSGWAGLAEAYGRVKPISIDYAVAEKCRSVALVAAGFDWLDVGSWDEYARFQESARFQEGGSARGDAAHNRKAPVYSAGSSNCFVDADLPVALCGVEDLIVTVRSGADGSPPSVLICRRGESQRVKEIVDAVKASGRTDLL